MVVRSFCWAIGPKRAWSAVAIRPSSPLVGMVVLPATGGREALALGPADSDAEGATEAEADGATEEAAADGDEMTSEPDGDGADADPAAADAGADADPDEAAEPDGVALALLDATGLEAIGLDEGDGASVTTGVAVGADDARAWTVVTRIWRPCPVRTTSASG